MTDKTGNRGIGDNLIKSPTNADHKLIYEYTSDALHVAVAFIQKLIIRLVMEVMELAPRLTYQAHQLVMPQDRGRFILTLL